MEWGRHGSCSRAGDAVLYTGYIMAEKYTHQKSEFVCVDQSRGTHPGSTSKSENGLLWYVKAVATEPT